MTAAPSSWQGEDNAEAQPVRWLASRGPNRPKLMRLRVTGPSTLVTHVRVGQRRNARMKLGALCRRSLRVWGAVVIGCLVVGGCGGESAQTKLERERLANDKVKAERADAAQAARQDERIKQLEREVAASKKKSTPTAAASVPGAPTPAATTVATVSGDWPGGSGYTVVLTSASSVAAARVVQRRASDAGLDAGLLNSSDFSSLRPGYWVVFSGTYSNEAGASARQARARALGFTDAYTRFVSR
jgi:hypothetical protein